MMFILYCIVLCCHTFLTANTHDSHFINIPCHTRSPCHTIFPFNAQYNNHSTFASARVGDSQFRDAYNERINQTSYEAHLDLIPFLPPSVDIMESMNPQMSEMIEGVLWSETSLSKKDNYKWDYQTLGNRKYINEQGEIIHEVTKELDKLRIAEIEEKTTVSWVELTQSHCSGCLSDGCGGRYFSAVASDVCSLCVQDE